jgi:flagellar L-ring protein precursor FlgH
MKRTSRIFPLATALLAVHPAVPADDLFDAAAYRPLTSDHRAYRVGDTLTVLVLENSSASANADTSSHKQSDLGIKVTGPTTQRNLGLGLSDDFDGKGSTVRGGKLLAQLSVSVIDVDRNGDLYVAGEQLLEINNDRQSIKLEGRVRREDISETNTVTSNRLADARISYVGDGVLGEAQRRGWLPRIFSFLGLI